MTEYLTVIRITADAGMAVLILLVQLIIYPAFHAIADDVFSAWHRKYMNAIGFVVMPLMFIQAGCIALQLFTAADGAAVLSALAVTGAWAVTFTFSVPCHRTLQWKGKDPETIDRLITTNRLRTVCWIIAFAAGLAGWAGRG